MCFCKLIQLRQCLQNTHCSKIAIFIKFILINKMKGEKNQLTLKSLHLVFPCNWTKQKGVNGTLNKGKGKSLEVQLKSKWGETHYEHHVQISFAKLLGNLVRSAQFNIRKGSSSSIWLLAYHFKITPWGCEMYILKRKLTLPLDGSTLCKQGWGTEIDQLLKGLLLWPHSPNSSLWLQGNRGEDRILHYL